MNDADIVAHWVPAQQHVPEIERTIRTVKDRYRCAYYSLPFQAIPKVMIKALAKRVVKFVNMFPPKGGVSEYWSPRAIVTGTLWTTTQVTFVHLEVFCRLQMSQAQVTHQHQAV